MGAYRPRRAHPRKAARSSLRVARWRTTAPERGGRGMQVLDTFLDAMGNTPLVRLHTVTRGLAPTVLAKLEMLNPGGSVKDRIGIRMIEDAERRGLLAARWHDRRADVGQHRPRARDRGRDPRVSLHLRDAGQDERREDRPAPCLRGRGRDHADLRAARIAGVLLLGGGTARERDPGCLPAEPVLQPGEPRHPRGEHRSRDLGADRRPDRRVRRRRRHRRHDHGGRPIPEADEPRHHDRRRRHGGLGLHRATIPAPT